MKYVVAIVGSLIAAAFLAISAYMNYSFGLTISSDPNNSELYGAVSICIDLLKALIPLIVVYAWARKSYVGVVSGLIFFSLATVYSISSSIGFASTSRAQSTGERAALVQAVTSAEKRLKAKQRQIKALDHVRPQSVIESALAQKRKHRSWSSSNECTNATVQASRSLCAEIDALKAERSDAARKAALIAERDAVQLEYDTARKKAFAEGITNTEQTQADAQISAIQRLLAFVPALSVESSDVELGLVILLAGISELGSGFGFFFALGHLRSRETGPVTPTEPIGAQPQDKQETASTAALSWAEDRLWMGDEASSTPATDLHEDYRDWCAKRGMDEVLSATAFGRWMTEQEFSRAKRRGKVVYLGVRLKTNADIVKLATG